MEDVVDERRRHELYLELGRVLGQDKATTLMELLPPVPASELVTKSFLRAELGDLRAGVHAEMARNTRMLLFAMIAVFLTQTSIVVAAISLALP